MCTVLAIVNLESSQNGGQMTVTHCRSTLHAPKPCQMRDDSSKLYYDISKHLNNHKQQHEHMFDTLCFDTFEILQIYVDLYDFLYYIEIMSEPPGQLETVSLNVHRFKYS